MNDLAFFLQHLLFAIRKLFPEACQNTLALANASEPQSAKMLSAELVNELLEIKAPFVLVLDDYGFIRDPDIHELLNQMINFSPGNIQLVVMSRRDPPFSLHSLRAQADLVEIRQTDLQFTIPETVAFLGKAIKLHVDEQSCVYLHEKVEGWVTGLRLIALRLQNRDNIDDLLRKMKGGSQYIREYLMTEVLSCQSTFIRDGLLKTSILNRFNASLYSALCHPEDCELCGPECDGQLFINQLVESNLFCISLDDQGEWFRYHHLFQQVLQRSLERHYTADEITKLHQRASLWFEENGMIEEAFNHFQILGDSSSAGKLIVRHRHEFMNKEQWGRLRRLINMLPRALVDGDPELLLQDGWVLWNQMRIADMAEILDRVESLQASLPIEIADKERLSGEVAALRSIQYYLTPPCDGDRVITYAKRAAQNISRYNHSTRGLAIIMLALSYQLTGNLAVAFKVILAELNHKEAQQNTYHTRLLIILCMIYWLEADPSYMRQTAEKLVRLSKELSLQESAEIGKHYVGLSYYCCNELDQVEQYLKEPAAMISKVNVFNFAHSSFVLSLTYLAQTRKTEVKETVDSVVQYAIDTGNTTLLALVDAFKAELALRQGNIVEAANWAKNYEPEPFTTAHRFYVPQLTFVRVLLAQKTPESKTQADELLCRLHDFYLSIHHKYCLINVLALQAVLHNLMGDKLVADQKLSEALALAEQGGYIRIFVDLGPEMAELLERQKKSNLERDYIQRLLDAFTQSRLNVIAETIPASKPVGDMSLKGSVPFSNPLTNREQEILKLFARRLRNNEIAEKLCISDNTVKRHATNIFRKLNVQNRRKAV
ncbi:MAG: hypothetical protein JRJ68_11115, partial [Deltaproteobacteria bacterium]|nr:hypothetical protein [Deltaproteobacteria bacterium]